MLKAGQRCRNSGSNPCSIGGLPFGPTEKRLKRGRTRFHQSLVAVVAILHSPTSIVVVQKHHRREPSALRQQVQVLSDAAPKVAQVGLLALLLVVLWQPECERPGPDVTIGLERQGKWRVILVEARRLHARALPVAPTGRRHALGRVGGSVEHPTFQERSAIRFALVDAIMGFD